MKIAAAILCIAFIAACLWLLDIYLAPTFFDSRIERLGETNLPIVSISGRTIYCRMKAGDFRFSLPPGTYGTNPVITSGGFDSIHGTVEARYEGSHQLTSKEYEDWVTRNSQVGGSVSAAFISNGLLVKFDYFGDK